MPPLTAFVLSERRHAKGRLDLTKKMHDEVSGVMKAASAHSVLELLNEKVDINKHET